MKKSVLFVFIFFFSIFSAQKNEEFVRIDFSSICCGTPAEKPLMSFVEDFRIKNKLKDFEIWQETGLGFEGEYALFIGIDALNCKKKKEFLLGLKTIIDDFERVRNTNKDGNIQLREELIKKDELLKRQKTPSNQFSKFILRKPLINNKK